jgi:hypothetical protein
MNHHLKISTQQDYAHTESLTSAVFPRNSDSAIFAVPPLLRMAPPLPCQEHNKERIQAAASEIVLKREFEE